MRRGPRCQSTHDAPIARPCVCGHPQHSPRQCGKPWKSVTGIRPCLCDHAPATTRAQCVLRAGHARVAPHADADGVHWESAELYQGIAAKRRGGIITIDPRLASLEQAAWTR